MGNIDLNDNEKKRLNDFFENVNEENANYYVYALCDGGVPFYVGKGIGIRCLNHEESLDEVLEEYKKDDLDVDSAEIKEKISKEITMKLNRINDARSKDAFDIIIVKFGLTEHEAFMVESSVINAMEFCGIELTNIVNGHTSFKERETGTPTKARFIDDMLKECCPPIVSLSDISEFLTKNVSFDCKIDEIAFINYNKYYPFCKNETDTWDAVRGCWRSDEEKARKVKYIFAMHNNIVKGIFKVKKDGEKFADYQKIASVKKPLNPIKDSNINEYFNKNKLGKISDVLAVKKVMAAINDNPFLMGKVEELSEITRIDKNMFYRGFYACNIEDMNEDKDLLLLREKFMYCCVDKNELKMPQASVKFLYSSGIMKK